MKKFNWKFYRDKSVILFIVAVVLLSLAGFDFYSRHYLYDEGLTQPEVVQAEEMHASGSDNLEELRQLLIALGVMGFIVLAYGYHVLFSLKKEEEMVDYRIYKS